MPSVDVTRECAVCHEPFVIPAFTSGRQPTKCLAHRAKPRKGSRAAQRSVGEVLEAQRAAIHGDTVVDEKWEQARREYAEEIDATAPPPEAGEIAERPLLDSDPSEEVGRRDPLTIAQRQAANDGRPVESDVDAEPVPRPTLIEKLSIFDDEPEDLATEVPFVDRLTDLQRVDRQAEAIAPNRAAFAAAIAACKDHPSEQSYLRLAATALAAARLLARGR